MPQPLVPAGVLIVFDGIDGAGKTTQAARLARRLREFDLDVVESKEPTNGTWGSRLRASASTGRLDPDSELDLFLKDRREHVETVIRPGLARGAVVIVDRYFVSTAAYQGARGKDPEEILRVNESFAPHPDVLFLLDVPPEVGRRRIADRGDRANLFESVEGLARAAEIFRSLRRSYICKLNGEKSIDDLESTILIGVYEGYVAPRLASSRPSDVQLQLQQTLTLARAVAADDTVSPEMKAQALLQQVDAHLRSSH